MSRFSQFIGQLQTITTNRWQHDLYLDFGSAQTKILFQKTVVWQQPTLLAWHTNRQSVVAVGEQAARFRGKTAEFVELVEPIQEGVVADLFAAQAYLQTVWKELQHRGISPGLIAPRCWCAVPATMFPVEIEQLTAVIRASGFPSVRLIKKGLAMVSLPELRQISQAHVIVDLGAETTEMSAFMGNQPLQLQTSLKSSGNQLTQLLVSHLNQNHHIQISVQTAEKLKQQLLVLVPSQTATLTVRGKDAVTNEMSTFKVTAVMCDVVYQAWLESLVTALKQVLMTLSAEVVTQIGEQGIWLTGGGSLLPGLPEMLAEHIGIPVLLAKNPELALVNSLRSYHAWTRKS